MTAYAHEPTPPARRRIPGWAWLAIVLGGIALICSCASFVVWQGSDPAGAPSPISTHAPR